MDPQKTTCGPRLGTTALIWYAAESFSETQSSNYIGSDRIIQTYWCRWNIYCHSSAKKLTMTHHLFFDIPFYHNDNVQWNGFGIYGVVKCVIKIKLTQIDAKTNTNSQ